MSAPACYHPFSSFFCRLLDCSNLSLYHQLCPLFIFLRFIFAISLSFHVASHDPFCHFWVLSLYAYYPRILIFNSSYFLCISWMERLYPRPPCSSSGFTDQIYYCSGQYIQVVEYVIEPKLLKRYGYASTEYPPNASCDCALKKLATDPTEPQTPSRS